MQKKSVNAPHGHDFALARSEGCHYGGFVLRRHPQIRIAGDPAALYFSALEEAGLVSHAFTLRVARAGGDWKGAAHPEALRDYHERVLRSLGFSRRQLAVAQQAHGNRVAVVDQRPELPIGGVDGLLTNQRGLPLGIYVADCSAVFIVDRETSAIALLHSGKRGTQLNIVGEAMQAMSASFGTNPANCLAVLSPSIGPCHYEMDIWKAIELQLATAGVRDVVNPRLCTACHVEQFYSYRAEKGQTGRLLAVLALR
jgi:copper oxidase (laccase) domain-containing protein